MQCVSVGSFLRTNSLYETTHVRQREGERLQITRWWFISVASSKNNISHLIKRNIIFKSDLVGDMLVARRVCSSMLGQLSFNRKHVSQATLALQSTCCRCFGRCNLLGLFRFSLPSTMTMSSQRICFLDFQTFDW